MLRRLFSIILLFTAKAYCLPFYNSFTSLDYITQYRELALKEMRCYNIPASIILAQAMVESGNGSSNLATNANNHFGIKCHKEWSGPTFIMDDDEKDECFRKYESVVESYSDHSLFLCSRKWYAFLFQLPKTDYVAWARGLKRAGYATHPAYAEMLIEIIEKNRLYELDTMEYVPKVITEETINYASREITIKTRELIELISTFDLNKLKDEPVADTIQDSVYKDYFNSVTLQAVDGSGSGFSEEGEISENTEKHEVVVAGPQTAIKTQEEIVVRSTLNISQYSKVLDEAYQDLSVEKTDGHDVVVNENIEFTSCKNALKVKTFVPLNYATQLKDDRIKLETPPDFNLPVKNFKAGYFAPDKNGGEDLILNVQLLLVE